MRCNMLRRPVMVLVVCLLSLSVLSGCALIPAGVRDEQTTTPDESVTSEGMGSQVSGTAASFVPDRDEAYYELSDVVLYLDTYGELPQNYVTKKEARNAGWQGGNPSSSIEGAAIGGDRFGNYEGTLPTLTQGSDYRECDIGTDGQPSRGARRLIYVDDGDDSNGCAPYYYTEDHYETFVELKVVDGEVVEGE